MRIRVISTLVLGGVAAIVTCGFAASNAPANAPRSNAPNSRISTLLNKANAINYEEIEMGKLAYDKAGDNQALMTLGQTRG